MIRTFAILLLVGFLFLPDVTKSHVFYMSVCEIKIEEDRKTIGVKVRAFKDDMHKALLSYINKQELRANTEDENALASYLNSVIKIYNGGEELALTLVSSAADDDARVFRLKAKAKSNLRSIRLRNHLLLELFDTQTNMSKFYFMQTKKIENLNSRISSTTFTF